MLDPVSPGKPFRPSALDTSAIHAFVKRGLLGTSVKAPGVPGPQTGGSYVLVRNDTGADLPQWTAVGLGGQVFADYTGDGFKQQGIMIALADDWGRQLAVVQEPIANGKIGLACVSGFSIGLYAGTLPARATRLIDPQDGLAYWILGGPRRITAAFTGATLIGGQLMRWNYSWAQVRQKADLTWETFAGAMTSTTWTAARNTVEDRNPASKAVGGMTGIGFVVSSTTPGDMLPLGSSAMTGTAPNQVPGVGSVVIDLDLAEIEGTKIARFSLLNTWGCA